MNELNGYDDEDLRIGMSASFSKTITEADVDLFSGVSEESNAMHINEEFAAATQFGGRMTKHADCKRDICGHFEQAAGSGNDLPGPEPALHGARATGSDDRHRDSDRAWAAACQTVYRVQGWQHRGHRRRCVGHGDDITVAQCAP